MSVEPILDIRNLHVTLPTGGDRPYAVEGVSLDLKPDEILCIVGESGSGKSMMARAIMGLLPGSGVDASSGSISFRSEDLLIASNKHMRSLRGSQIAMIFQEPMTALNPLMTIGQQIEEVLEIHTSLPSTERLEKVLKILADVHLPDPQTILDAYPHQLSGGQRQRAMIAMALILDPKVIIADEPTTALDVTTQAQILKLIRDIQKSHGTGVLFITHDFSVVAEIADRVAVMQYGKLVELGSADEVLNNPQAEYTRTLIGAVPGMRPSVRSVDASAPIILDAIALKKTFVSGGGFLGGKRREVRAVRDASLSLRLGETIGIVGESGSGKSTLARMIIRLIDADEGEIILDDTDILRLSGNDLLGYRKRVQMVFQDPFATLNPRYRIGRIIAEGPLLRGVPKDEAYKKVYDLLELVGLEKQAAERFPHEFSGGQRQRIGIARALALDPEILIADEPVSALDVSVQAQVLKLFADIREKFQLSMLFITHDLCVAAQVCDHILVMQRGRIVEHGRTADVFSDPQHEYTQALFASVPGREWISARESVIETARA